MSPEEHAFWELQDKGKLCATNREILWEAGRVANDIFLASRVFVYCYPWEVSAARERMRESAEVLNVEELEELAQVARIALDAQASVDFDGRDAPEGYREYREDLHRFYRMVHDMVAETYRVTRVKRLATLREPREKPSDDPEEDLPF
jgi:hypothetical protein